MQKVSAGFFVLVVACGPDPRPRASTFTFSPESEIEGADLRRAIIALNFALGCKAATIASQGIPVVFTDTLLRDDNLLGFTHFSAPRYIHYDYIDEKRAPYYAVVGDSVEDVATLTLLHEIGHLLLGPKHSLDRNDIMHAILPAESVIDAANQLAARFNGCHSTTQETP